MHTTRLLEWESAYRVVEPGINAEGVHTYPFDPVFPIDVGFFVHAGRHNVRMNRHDYLEVIYVYAGETEIQIREHYFHVKKGNLLIIGPDIYHRILNRPNLQVKLASLNFRPEVIRGGAVNGDEEQYLLPFLSQDSYFPHVIPPATGIPGEIMGLIHRIYDELPVTSELSRVAVKTYLKMIMVILAKYYGAYLGSRGITGRKQKAIHRLGPVFDCLERCYGEAIRVEGAARLCAMSTSHFMNFFKRVTGQTFVAYLNSFRIAKAQTLLATTERSISEISQETGFCGQSYFGKIFHKLVGMTPHAYRHRMSEVKRREESPPEKTGPLIEESHRNELLKGRMPLQISLAYFPGPQRMEEILRSRVH